MKSFVTALVLLFTLLLHAVPSAAARPEYTLKGYFWEDANCDGVRQDDEPLHKGTEVYLFAAGEDGVVHTADDQVLDIGGMGGEFWFTNGGAEDLDYRITILAKDHPAGFVPAPYQAGADRSRDNDLTRPLADFPNYWSTNGFQMSATETITGVDIGLCRVQYTSRTFLPLLGK